MTEQGIYSQRCYINGSLQEATIYFEKGIITQIKKGLPDTFYGIYNAAHKVLMPGIIDAHVHVNEPGRTGWEGFNTATQAAAAGGVTTIVDMPLNASPVTTTAKALEEKLAATTGKLNVNVGFYGGVVPQNIQHLETLIKAGVLGIKAFLTHSGIDEFPNVSKEDLEKAMPIISKYKVPLLVHCELSDNNHHKALDQEPTSYEAYLQSRPKVWENNAVELMIRLCKKYNCPVHIVHVSSAEALPLIKKAKEEKLLITAETAPHYLLFSAEEINDGATSFKCAPPIRERENNELLKDALVDGTLDFIATDHSPAPPNLKEIESGNFSKAWGGIAGLQFLLSASWSSLKDTLSLEKFIPLLTEHPAKFLGIHQQKGFIKKGFDADFVVWHPEEKFTVKKAEVFHKHKISPYIDRPLFGTVHQTYVAGQLVYHQKKIINKNCGSWLLRK